MRTLVPKLSSYKPSHSKGDSKDEQYSDWVYSSGRVAQGEILLGFLMGELKE